jgi:hypothetical protein
VTTTHGFIREKWKALIYELATGALTVRMK